MDEQDEYIKGSQKSSMDTPDHYIDLSKYETESDIDEEIMKLQQDIEIRRRVLQRMGANDDDETILIIDEKIKLLDAEKKKRQRDRSDNRRFAFNASLFIFIGFILIFQPLVGVGLIVTVVFIRILIRKVRRKKRGTVSSEESGVEVERILDK